MIFRPLTASLIAVSLVGGVSCSKKKKSSGTAAVTALATEATEDSLLSAAVATGALAISSIDILGVGTEAGASLRLAGSDFDNDKARTFVYDASLESLKQVSGILCFFNQAAYIDMAGKGPYIAQADMETCFNDGGGESGGSKLRLAGANEMAGSNQEDAAASRQKNLTTVFVESTRESDLHPLIVKAWFDMTDGHAGETTMQVKMVIAEGQSDQNPLGIFKLSWEGTSAGTVIQKGFIEAKRAADSGKISLNFVEESSFGTEKFSQSLASILDYDSTVGEVVGGVVRTLTPDWNSMSSPGGEGSVDTASVEAPALQGMTNIEYLAAFNTARFLRKEVATGSSQCLAKDEFDYNVYRYGLYDATTGSRKEINSGFPVTYEKNGETIYGWAGYWGVWLGMDSITDGMTVNRVDYETGATTPYTVKAAPGKLMKRTKEAMPLSKLHGMEFQGWDNVNQRSVVIAYNKNTNAFEIIGTQNQYGQTDYLATAEPYALGNYGDKYPNNFWSQGLGGSVIVYSNSAGAVVGTDAYYYKEENVTGSLSANLTLYCYSNCMKGPVSSWSDVYTFGEEKTYTFNATTMELTDNTSGQVVKISGGDQYFNFASINAMTTTSLADPYTAWEQDVTYTYYTGTDSWSQHIALRDANGQTVSFEAPLFIKYTHTQANDRSGEAGSKYYDKPYLLNYEGFGNLWGIPSGPDANGFWKANFALKDGALLGDANQYKAKALDMELAMKQKDLSECGTLVTASPELPTIDAFKSPNNGTAPVVTGAPSVVEGVVKVSK